MNTVIDEPSGFSMDVLSGYLRHNPYAIIAEEREQAPTNQGIREKALQYNNLLLLDAFDISRREPELIRSPGVKPAPWQAKPKPSLGPLVMQETHDGVVKEAFCDTAVVIYDVGEDRVEQTYDQSQFIDERLPSEGTRLRVKVEVFELPADESEDFDDEIVELTDEAIAHGPEKLTEPTEF